MAMLLVLTAFLTLGLPKEFYDPHLGIDNDIFCKSLYSVGIEAQEPESLLSSECYFIELQAPAGHVYRPVDTARGAPTRGPPLPAVP